MTINIRERISSVLPATVTSFELVSDTVPVMHAGIMGLQIWGVFVGQSAGEAPVVDGWRPGLAASRFYKWMDSHCGRHTGMGTMVDYFS